MKDGETMLVFISAFVSPHTLPLGIELSKYYERVIFINTMALTQERKQMGYDVADSRVQIRELAQDGPACRQLINEAKDVILAGTGFDLVAQRISDGKRVFIAHERLLKKGAVKLLDPRTWRIAKFCRSVRNKPVYLLAIGDNAAKDFRLLGFNSQKIYRFGYFPQVSTYTPAQLRRKDEKCRILWVGRFVDFKRPVMALKAFKGMEADFSLTMAGSGALFAKAQAYAKKHHLPVEFLGNIASEEVEAQMLQSHILLSTSHKGEGWGAVINEGMNRGCAVVCAKAIGCAGSLATKENAVLFRTYSIADLRRALKEAAQNQAQLGQNGYATVTQQFNAEVAARRFAELADSDKTQVYTEGLLSNIF